MQHGALMVLCTGATTSSRDFTKLAETGTCQLKHTATRRAFHLWTRKPQHGASIGEEPGRKSFIVSTWETVTVIPLKNSVYGTISSENLFSGTVIFQSFHSDDFCLFVCVQSNSCSYQQKRMINNFIECKLSSLFNSAREALEHTSPTDGLSIHVQADKGSGMSRSWSFPVPWWTTYTQVWQAHCACTNCHRPGSPNKWGRSVKGYTCPAGFY